MSAGNLIVIGILVFCAFWLLHDIFVTTFLWDRRLKGKSKTQVTEKPRPEPPLPARPCITWIHIPFTRDYVRTDTITGWLIRQEDALYVLRIEAGEHHFDLQPMTQKDVQAVAAGLHRLLTPPTYELVGTEWRVERKEVR